MALGLLDKGNVSEITQLLREGLKKIITRSEYLSILSKYKEYEKELEEQRQIHYEKHIKEVLERREAYEKKWKEEYVDKKWLKYKKSTFDKIQNIFYLDLNSDELDEVNKFEKIFG